MAVRVGGKPWATKKKQSLFDSFNDAVKKGKIYYRYDKKFDVSKNIISGVGYFLYEADDKPFPHTTRFEFINGKWISRIIREL
jgi:hypothetical protein